MKIAAACHYAPRAMLAAIIAAIRSEERAALDALRSRYSVRRRPDLALCPRRTRWPRRSKRRREVTCP